MIEINEKEHVLHIIYDHDDDLANELLCDIYKIASIYDDLHPHTGTWHFPMSVAREYFKSNPESLLRPYGDMADFVIVYREGDTLAKNHERQHAKYFTDPFYREFTKELFLQFTPEKREEFKVKMGRENEPDDSEMVLDEFQSIYFAPNPNFFKPPPTYDAYFKYSTNTIYAYNRRPYDPNHEKEDRNEKNDKNERKERSERSDKNEKTDKNDKNEKEFRKHKSPDHRQKNDRNDKNDRNERNDNKRGGKKYLKKEKE